MPARLIDSNLDWGQDLIALQKWWKETIPNEPIGLAYFGQINPSIFKLRGESFDWFLPFVPPKAIRPMSDSPSPLLVGPAKRLTPGYYAVSIPWFTACVGGCTIRPLRFRSRDRRAPAWYVLEDDVFGYFRRFKPVERIGHSIYVYHLSADDIAHVGTTGHGPRHDAEVR